jgi:GalNAc-alpha-(1->4)-GalNAc-alpha-(1->3)-diNAcBac-PP-undecaprenol alpha-1,4-N-acetyl-D-galactosaminyltransferase
VHLHKEAVALYFYRLGGTGGGAPRMVCLLASALVTRGFDVHLLSWDDPPAQSFYPLASEVKWHRLGFRPGPVDKLRRIAAVTKLLRQYGIRVVVGFVMSGDRTIFAAAKLAAAKLVAAERNAPDIYHMRYGRLDRWLSLACLHLADRIAVQLPDFVEGYPATLHDRIDVIPNPVTVAPCRARPEQPATTGRFTLLAVSRLDRVQKRLHKLIEAFALVAKRNPQWDLLVVGDGPDEAALRRHVAGQAISGRIRFEKSTRNLSQIYAQSHLFAIPSRWEGFSNALAEALAHGLPAVGFQEAPGVAKLITDGETGWLADGLDDEAKFAEVLDEAMGNGAERARRAANGVRSMAVYAPEAQFDRWANLIRSVSEKDQWTN